MVLKTKKAVKSRFPGGIDKLEIGSGSNPEPGYVHLDIQPNLRQLDILADARKIPIPSNFVSDHIRAVHIMEHFCHPVHSGVKMRTKYGTVTQVLDEVYRILKPGGKFKIVTPDFDKIALSTTLNRVPKEWLQRWTVGGHEDEYDVHHWLWTKNDAKKLFSQAGFKNLHDWNPISNKKEIVSMLLSPPKPGSKDWYRFEWYHWLFFEGTK